MTVVWEPLNIVELVVINNMFPVVFGELVLTKENVLPATVAFGMEFATVTMDDKAGALLKLQAFVDATIGTVVSV